MTEQPRTVTVYGRGFTARRCAVVTETKSSVKVDVRGDVITFNKISKLQRGTTRHDFFGRRYSNN